MKPTLGKTEAGKELVIDVPKLLATRMLLDAESGGGKTVALKRLLEQTHGHVQQIIIDPEGEFSTLREKFDYLLCAPEGADAIANPKTAAILARKLRETRVSAVIDIYDLRPAEQRLFVRLFVEELLAAPKNLWNPCLVVIDEAQIFAPEQGEAESLGAIMDLRGRGRKRGLCLILATPRLAQLSKDACAGLQNKLIGVTTLDLDVKRAARDLSMQPNEATTLLRNLEPGEFYCFGPALTRAITKIKVGSIQTLHGQHVVGKDTRPPAPSEKIKDVIAKLTDLPKEAEQESRTLADYKREVANLKREMTLAKKNADPAVVAKAVNQERQKFEQEIKTGNLNLQRQYDRLKALAEEAMQFIVKITADETLLKEGVDTETVEKSIKKAVDEIRRQIDARFESQRRLLENHRRQGARLFKDMESFLEGARVPIEVSVTKQEPVVVNVKTPASTIQSKSSVPLNGELDGPKQRIVDAIAWMESIGVTEPETTAVASLAGYSVNGGAFNNPRGRLRTDGLIEYRGTKLALTEKGRALANMPDTPLTSEEMHQRVLGRLPTPERKLLAVALEVYPGEITDQELAERTGYAAGGGAFNNPKGRLRTMGLVTYPASKTVRAADILFPGT